MSVPVYMDPEVVKKLSATDWMKLKFVDDATFTTWINDNVISGIESRVAQITGKTWTADTVPEGVKQIAHIAGSNVLIYLRVNQLGPLIQRGEFNLAAPQVPTFTEVMIKDLERFKQCTEQIVSSDYKTQALKDTWEES